MLKLAPDKRNFVSVPATPSAPPITAQGVGFHDTATGVYIQVSAWQSGKVEVAFQDGNSVMRIAVSPEAAAWMVKRIGAAKSHAEKNRSRLVGSG